MKVFSVDAKALNKNIIVEEIEHSIKEMANDKSPGLDGLSTKFYKKNIDWISLELFHLYNEAFEYGTLS